MRQLIQRESTTSWRLVVAGGRSDFCFRYSPAGTRQRWNKLFRGAARQCCMTAVKAKRCCMIMSRCETIMMLPYVTCRPYTSHTTLHVGLWYISPVNDYFKDMYGASIRPIGSMTRKSRPKTEPFTMHQLPALEEHCTSQAGPGGISGRPTVSEHFHHWGASMWTKLIINVADYAISRTARLLKLGGLHP